MSPRISFAIDDQSSGNLILLEPGVHLLGRSRRCGIALDGQGVSRIHTRLSVSLSEVEIIDLQSTNGTYLNERAVQGRTIWYPGATMRIGKHRFGLAALRRLQALPDELATEYVDGYDATTPDYSGSALPVLERLEILAEDLRRQTTDVSTSAAFRASVDDLLDGAGVLFPVLGGAEREHVTRLIQRAFAGSRDLESRIWQAAVMRRLRPVAIDIATLC